MRRGAYRIVTRIAGLAIVLAAAGAVASTFHQ
jgi:hypothetical protein